MLLYKHVTIFFFRYYLQRDDVKNLFQWGWSLQWYPYRSYFSQTISKSKSRPLLKNVNDFFFLSKIDCLLSLLLSTNYTICCNIAPYPRTWWKIAPIIFWYGLIFFLTYVRCKNNYFFPSHFSINKNTGCVEW